MITLINILNLCIGIILTGTTYVLPIVIILIRSSHKRTKKSLIKIVFIETAIVCIAFLLISYAVGIYGINFSPAVFWGSLSYLIAYLMNNKKPDNDLLEQLAPKTYENKQIASPAQTTTNKSSRIKYCKHCGAECNKSDFKCKCGKVIHPFAFFKNQNVLLCTFIIISVLGNVFTIPFSIIKSNELSSTITTNSQLEKENKDLKQEMLSLNYKLTNANDELITAKEYTKKLVIEISDEMDTAYFCDTYIALYEDYDSGPYHKHSCPIFKKIDSFYADTVNGAINSGHFSCGLCG